MGASWNTCRTSMAWSGIVSLIGETDAHAAARDARHRGHDLRVVPDHLPPLDELRTVLELLDQPAPVLVHCKGGLDRTGYTMVFYRVTRQGWTLEDALEEMTRYWHVPERHPHVHTELRDALDALDVGPSAMPLAAEGASRLHANCQDDLAEVRIARDVGLRRLHLAQRKGPVDDGPDRARLDQRAAPVL